MSDSVDVSGGISAGRGIELTLSECSMLSITAPAGQTALVFAAVFVIVWVGAAVVTLNAQLLGGTM